MFNVFTCLSAMKNKRKKIKPKLSRTKEIIKITAKIYETDKPRNYQNKKMVL